MEENTKTHPYTWKQLISDKNVKSVVAIDGGLTVSFSVTKSQIKPENKFSQRWMTEETY